MGRGKVGGNFALGTGFACGSTANGPVV
jgi:hypothetical protein